MKESLWGILIIALGLVIISILLLVQNLTSANEEDYYLGKEIMQSAMTEAADYGNYQLTNGKIVMSREKFVEIFLRRFAESVTPNKTYQIDFYQIYEYPPAATVRIRTTTGTTNVKGNAVNVNVDTIISAILVAGVGNDIRFMEIKDNFDTKSVISAIDLIGSTGATYDVNADGKIDLEDAATIEYFVYGRYLRGDINKDGNLTIEDATEMDKLISSKSYTLVDELICDVNNDKKLTSADSKAIRDYLNGKINTPITNYSKGDVNRDGRVNLQDAVLISNYISNSSYFDNSQIALADFNGDGEVNNADLYSSDSKNPGIVEYIRRALQ